MNFPVTPAIRALREQKVEFEPHVFEYIEKGGTRHSSAMLGVDEHLVIKTLVFETNDQKPFIVLMHGDLQVSSKGLARYLGVKSVAPVSPEKAAKLTGYKVGGISPFGIKAKLPIYAEKTIFDAERIYINGGKRGFLVRISSQALKQFLTINEIEVGVKK
jgi:Cys-tRNA(Pro) deacylase